MQQLASPRHRQEAKQRLRFSGADPLAAVRQGLKHPKAVVRQMCVNILDRLVDLDSLPDLVAALDDEDVDVRARALHALACDACKQNECRPDDELFVPRAIELLGHHPDADLRAAAVDALGKAAGRRPDAVAALTTAADHDPHRGIRNMARIRLRRLPRRAAREGA